VIFFVVSGSSSISCVVPVDLPWSSVSTAPVAPAALLGVEFALIIDVA
jgi:hypothetical protein